MFAARCSRCGAPRAWTVHTRGVDYGGGWQNGSARKHSYIMVQSLAKTVVSQELRKTEGLSRRVASQEVSRFMPASAYCPGTCFLDFFTGDGKRGGAGERRKEGEG